MTDPYVVLGVSRDATDDQIKDAYRALARKYHPDNYDDDNPLKDLANEKMQEINAAYDQIQRERSQRGEDAYAGNGTYYQSYSGQNEGASAYAEIRRLLNAHKFGEAEKRLSEIPNAGRSAEWHYLFSIVLLKKGFANDAMRELETACNMEPSNLEYQRAKEMFNSNAAGYGSTYYGGTPYRRSRSDDVCNLCSNLICADCLCEMCGGDLIPCL